MRTFKLDQWKSQSPVFLKSPDESCWSLLLRGSCFDLIKADFSDGFGPIEAMVTDPPYGIKASEMAMGRGKDVLFVRTHRWDRVRPNMPILMPRTKYHIIWGGNYFTDQLPPTNDWLIWDKDNPDRSFSEVEMAWTDLEMNSRIMKCSWRQYVDGQRQDKLHITQKPQRVMEWCLRWLPTGTRTVIDPFMGSGTTGVACAHLGLNFVGIELEEENFEIACKRISDEHAKGDLFRAEQMELAL